MPERVAEAIEEIARPNRDDQQEKPQIQGDPALRRPRLIRNTPVAVAAVIVVVGAVAAGWAVFWALGLPAVSRQSALSIAGRLPVRVVAAALVAVLVGGLLAWAFRPLQTLRRGARTWATIARRRSPRVPLFGSLAAAVVIGVALAALATWMIGGAAFERAAGDADALEVTLPAIVGAVIAVALVVLYRRQKDAERAQFAHRFGAASTQLGASDTAVRIAGVYAMAAAADESSVFAQRQQCIDVLCGYLRLPYEPDSGSNHLSEFVSRTTWSATPPATNIEETRRQAVRQNDREVRETIVRVLAQRLQRSADTSWSANDFDLTGVLFEDARFAGEYMSFRRVRFSSKATTFGSASFKCLRASFDSPAEWKNVEFDWDNPPSGTQPAIPRCITPRPWPPYLAPEHRDDGPDGWPAWQHWRR